MVYCLLPGYILGVSALAGETQFSVFGGKYAPQARGELAYVDRSLQPSPCNLLGSKGTVHTGLNRATLIG